MNIQIRENINNRSKDQHKLIETNITNLGSYDISDTSLSFEVISSPDGIGEVMHSHNATNEKYLNYGSSTTPTLQLSLPDVGEYSIRILAKNIKSSNGEITTTIMNSDGELVNEISYGQVPSVTIFKSDPITLSYDPSNNAWI
jgi:hypothetical protein